MTITMNTRTIPLITFAFAICLFTGIASQRSYSQERKAVNLSPTRGLPFSDGIVAGDTLYVAGQPVKRVRMRPTNWLQGALAPRRLQHLRIFRGCSRPPASN
jgi:hypothetical protein